MNTPQRAQVARDPKFYDQAFVEIMQKITRMRMDDVITEDERRKLVSELLVEYSNLVQKTITPQ